MFSALRRRLPKPLRNAYHRGLAAAAAWRYRHPTRQLVTIGITGTSGKTTVCLLLHSILEQAGHPAAVATTAEFAIGSERWVNDQKMTMLGRFSLQRFLRRAKQAGCTHAIVETTSEGLAQNRHRGIDYDVAVLTNLTPEHIESHGSMAAYQRAKERLFHVLTLTARKPGVGKSIVVNADDPAAPAFLRHAADAYFTFSLARQSAAGADPVTVLDVDLSPTGSSFVLVHRGDSGRVALKLLGRMNVENAAAAAAAAIALGVPLSDIVRGLERVSGIPGRLEAISAGGVTVIVDYAFHKKAMDELYAAIEQMPHTRIIHVLGGTGGGRDRARRPVLGRLAGDRADVVIVTNEDPYDEDPDAIIDEVLGGVLAAPGKRLGENVWRVRDRHEAIRRAVALAQSGDLVLVTGKGSEQSIVVAGGKKVPWDDREEARTALNERNLRED